MGKKDQQTGERKTGNDKAKKTFDKYGKYTNKHLRIMEEIKEKQTLKQTIQENEKEKKEIIKNNKKGNKK
tara:strand:+ start:557 stop:766 length:210 start_codon:yes stop_codon:yes gene_type:complete